jgi:hydroxypyruvate isomerase
MLTRRMLGKLIAASTAVCAIDRASLYAQPDRPESGISVMMWTMKKWGTFEENLERVAKAGYRYVELVDEFKRWTPEDTQRILARMKVLGIGIDAMAGMVRGFADPAGVDAYVAELRELVPVAKHLGCRQIILMSGKRLAGVSVEEQHRASIETLAHAVPVLLEAGVVGLIEPIDRIENPTIYLDGVTEAFAIANAVNSPSVKVLYDLYHEQRGYGNLIEKLNANIASVGLIHVADVPERHEPGSGEIDYMSIYRRLGQLKYTGKIAMEFYPTGDIVLSLRKAREEAIRELAMQD